VDNRTIEKKLNLCKNIESKNIDFQIYKYPKENYFCIVKNNKIQYTGSNIFPNIIKKNEINFAIKDIDNQKILNNYLNNRKIIKQIEIDINEAKNNKNINKYIFYDKKNEINNKRESIQKNSQDNFFKDKKNIIIEPKEFERNINDNNIIRKKKKNFYDESKTFQENLKKSKKIYGFINNGNNCYLNSSLQLLTRINDLKEGILNFNETNQDINTNGQLTKEFKKILNKIENEEERIISPDKLKRVMANIDERYNKSHQEDANEFITFFLDALVAETTNKNKVIDKIEVYDKNDQDAYNKFYKKFYIKKGYSFILELLYGTIKTEKICKSCKERNLIKFSSFKILELPIYNFAKSNRNGILNLKEILNKYLSEYKNNGFPCIKCKDTNVYTNTTIYTLPKYLIIFFGRIVEKEYFYNEIKYPEEFNFNEYINNSIQIKANNNYKLECVVEHCGGAYSGHYTALCRIFDNCWYDFSDSYGSMHSQGFESKNAIILLYKAQ
jgi:ubiquitin C-terminal hydrolase